MVVPKQLAPQTLQNDADLFLGGKLATRAPFDVLDMFFGVRRIRLTLRPVHPLRGLTLLSFAPLAIYDEPEILLKQNNRSVSQSLTGNNNQQKSAPTKQASIR